MLILQEVGCNGSTISESRTHCHLGLLFQSDAKWSSHLNNLYEKACSRLNLLRMLKHLLDRSALVKVYFAFIRPILEYGGIVWDNCSQELSNLLENIQVEAARIITGLRKNSSRKALYLELGWEPLSKRRKDKNSCYSIKLFMV